MVTGGASGIGRATVLRLAAEGARVALFDIDDEGGGRVAAEVGGTHLPLDVSDLRAVPPAIDQVIGTMGSIHLLVNCAGWDKAQPFAETDPAFWQQVIGINLLGTIAVTHSALPNIVEGGAIVNVSSDAGRVGSTGEVVYSGAKAGVIGFTKALAREVAKRRIRVNCVAPGPTDTALLDSFDPSGKLAEAIVKQTPLRRLATPEDIASAILFLGSPEAGHITGQVLSVSGGLTMV